MGGGEIGERKARALLACGAQVTVVSPTATRGLAALALEGLIVERRRSFRRADLRGQLAAGS